MTSKKGLRDMGDFVKDQASEAGCFIVGGGVSVKGSFSVPERAVINGSVEGEITAREVLVGASGRITGKVVAEVIDVRGEINDTISASKALILRASGRATGSISYAELEIEKGARLRGALTILGEDGAAAGASAAAGAVERPDGDNRRRTLAVGARTVADA
jgi:cytoskeletal protein CcmA (bactofilin family)